MENNQTHKRRVRYSGTHPKTYKEKYKEHQPEKYPETVSKVIQKGSTPAGMHISICVNEILEFLGIQPGQKGLDATMGYGGHTQAMLECLQNKGHMVALDIDPLELEKTKDRLTSLGYGEEILTILNRNFAEIDQVATEYGPFDFILADLGVSSMQIDNPDRGFTYKREGPLDLRLNPEEGTSAAERLRHISKEVLTGMLIENADEPYAAEIAHTIVTNRKKRGPITTTTQLQETIAQALAFLPAKEQKEAIKKSCQRTFQALRIDVNNEYEVLYRFMEKLPQALSQGGKVAILTFHSGEDRIVKRAFRDLQRAGVYSQVATEVIRPSEEECALNSRARSTKMRWAIKA